MLNTKNISMTEGPLLKNIIFYTIPIIFANVFQLLFNAADTIVAGQFCGSVAVAAVGSNGPLVNLLVNIAIGISVGNGIITTQKLGAKDFSAVKKIVHTYIPTAVIIGGIISVIGFLFSGLFLRLMNTPAEILPITTVYLRIYFLGVISVSIYNFGASILKAKGDTKSPLIYLIVAVVLNIILNLIFVIVFKMGVAGIAFATIISQTVSAILIVRALFKRNDECKLILKEIKIQKPVFYKIIRVGLPTGIQNSMFAISSVIIQSAINSFGTIVVSGNTAAANIDAFIFTALNAFHQTSTNFTGQNIGAAKFERAKRVGLVCMLSASIVGLVLGTAVYFYGRPLLSVYITDSQPAIEAGMVRITYICLFYFLCSPQETLAGSLEGMGSTVCSMLISFIGACGFRIAWIFTIFKIVKFHTPAMLYASYPISWILTSVANAIACFIILGKIKSQYRKEHPIN